MAGSSDAGKQLLEDILDSDNGFALLGYDGLGPEDYAMLWRQQCGSVMEAALKEFVGEGRECPFDFGPILPSLSDFPPEFQVFHATYIIPIADMIQPLPEGTPVETTMLQRFEMIAPLIRAVLNALVVLDQLEFMREEIEGDYEFLLQWYSGKARGLSWVESFFGKLIPQPESCAAMARRA